MEPNKVCCPKCGSDQITANKKGFSGGKALVGGLLTGGVGLLAGTIGSSRVIITCLNCNNSFKPGESLSASSKNSFAKNKVHSKGTYQFMKVFMIIFLILFTGFTIGATVSQSWGFLAFCILMLLFGYAGLKNANTNLINLKSKNTIS